MEKETNHVIKLNSTEMHDLLAVLAYLAGAVNYAPDAPQREILRKKASDFHHFLSEEL